MSSTHCRFCEISVVGIYLNCPKCGRYLAPDKEGERIDPEYYELANDSPVHNTWFDLRKGVEVIGKKSMQYGHIVDYDADTKLYTVAYELSSEQLERDAFIISDNSPKLPGKFELRLNYPLRCYVCNYTGAGAQISLAMQTGANMGLGICTQCDTFLQLYVHDGVMCTYPMDEYTKLIVQRKDILHE